MGAFHPWSLLVSALALAIPATLLVASATAPRRAGVATSAALVLAGLSSLAAALAPAEAAGAAGTLGVRFDALTGVMLLLVAVLGATVTRYSRTYLGGAAGLERHLRWLLATLAAVTTIILADDLLVVAIAWTATSLALHRLLTFHRDRQAAVVTAHKKFLLSRLADVALYGSLGIVHHQVGSLDLDRIEAWAAAHAELPASMHVAAVLLVVAVVLRSAQLPFHGWLTQVMEAPTPVSALLHAGVVNVGGFVLFRVGPWVSHADLAQALLISFGLTSAVVAALVMATRTSAKSALAWSTCAQMGLMLVQCGLGAWHLALVHLVAHSLYKAHAFLRAGTTVEEWRLRAVTPLPSAPSASRMALGAAGAAAASILCAVAVGRGLLAPSPAAAASAPALTLLVGLSLVPLFARRPSGAGAAARAVGVVGLYAAWHAAAAHLVPLPSAAPSVLSWALVATCLAALFVVKSWLEIRPAGALARALHPWLITGLYLDERFTRWTFRLWPPPSPPRGPRSREPRVSGTVEVEA